MMMMILELDVAPYQVTPHIPVYCPFRPQTKQFHVLPHTFSPSFPVPAPTFHPPTLEFLQANAQSSSTFLSFMLKMANLLNLPGLTPLWTPRKLQILAELSIFQRYFTHPSHNLCTTEKNIKNLYQNSWEKKKFPYMSLWTFWPYVQFPW